MPGQTLVIAQLQDNTVHRMEQAYMKNLPPASFANAAPPQSVAAITMPVA
jgi:hypothetical protein